MRGRPPKPTRLKALAGNPGKRPLPTNPQFACAIPACPAHLLGEARKEWRRVTKELGSVGILAKVDRASLAAYCLSWQRWVLAEEHLSKEEQILTTDKGYRYPNPWLGVSNKALEMMNRFANQFGLTPSSRARINLPDPPNDDELDELMRRRKGGST